MRNLALMIVVAAAALFFSAPGNAFAHGTHHQMHQAKHDPAPPASVVRITGEQEAKMFASASSWSAADCPHQQTLGGCGCGCACSGHVPVALAAAATVTGVSVRLFTQDQIAARHEFRQPIFDLSRPPKSFA